MGFNQGFQKVAFIAPILGGAARLAAGALTRGAGAVARGALRGVGTVAKPVGFVAKHTLGGGSHLGTAMAGLQAINDTRSFANKITAAGQRV